MDCGLDVKGQVLSVVQREEAFRVAMLAKFFHCLVDVFEMMLMEAVEKRGELTW